MINCRVCAVFERNCCEHVDDDGVFSLPLAAVCVHSKSLHVVCTSSYLSYYIDRLAVLSTFFVFDKTTKNRTAVSL